MADFQQNFLNSVQGGLQIGQQIRAVQDRNKINALASQGYSTAPNDRQALLGQIANVDAGAARQQEQAFANTDERRNTTLANMARLLTTAPDQARPGLYQQMLPTLSTFGMSELPTEYNAETAPIINQAAQSIASAYGTGANSTPTDVRSFQQMTAGLSQEDQERARRINLGLDPRQSSAAISYMQVAGPDGVKRLVAVDPRQIGAQIVGDGAGYGSFSEVPQQMVPQGNSPAVFSQLASEFPAVTMTSGTRSAERNAQVGGQPNSQHLAGTAADYAVPANQKPAFISRARQLGYQAIDEGDHIHLQLPRGSGGGQNVFAGRRPEDEAAAVERAKTGVELESLPTKIALENQGAIERASGTARAEADAKREADLATAAQKKYVDAGTTLSLLEQAEPLIRAATGSMLGNARDQTLAAFGQTTDGAAAIAALNPIAANLTLAVPRMEGPQSDADRMLYQQAAGSFNNPNTTVGQKLASLQTMKTLAQKYRNPAAGSGNGLQTTNAVVDGPGSGVRRVNSAADYDALPSGTLFIAPDGSQRRKR